MLQSDTSEEKIITLYLFLNKYNHTINVETFRILSFPTMMSLLVFQNMGPPQTSFCIRFLQTVMTHMLCIQSSAFYIKSRRVQSHQI